MTALHARVLSAIRSISSAPPASATASSSAACNALIQSWEAQSGRILRVKARRTHAPHTASVVFTHGLGDTGEGWAWSFVDIAERMPHVEFLFPTARTVPVTCNGGMEMPAWYDIAGLDVNRLKMDAPGIHDSSALLHAIAHVEGERIGTASPELASSPSKRVVLGGFSQGAALSLFSAHTYEQPLAGIMALSGYCTQLGDLVTQKQAANLTTPLLMCHGEEDAVVPYALAKESFDWVVGSQQLRDNSSHATFVSFRGVGHESAPEEMKIVEDFLKKLLPADINSVSSKM